MRLTLLFMACCSVLTTWAQAPKQHLRILISYEQAGQYLEQAVETIEAINTIGKSTNVEYKAGHSVVLAPGFEARVGSVFTANIKDVNTGKEYSLQLNAYPNPFEQSTIIDYYLPNDGKVNLWIIDAQGKIVGELVTNETQSAGLHKVEWIPNNLKTGVYIPIVESNNQKAVSRLIKK